MGKEHDGWSLSTGLDQGSASPSPAEIVAAAGTLSAAVHAARRQRGDVDGADVSLLEIVEGALVAQGLLPSARLGDEICARIRRGTAARTAAESLRVPGERFDEWMSSPQAKCVALREAVLSAQADATFGAVVRAVATGAFKPNHGEVAKLRAMRATEWSKLAERCIEAGALEPNHLVQCIDAGALSTKGLFGKIVDYRLRAGTSPAGVPTRRAS